MRRKINKKFSGGPSVQRNERALVFFAMVVRLSANRRVPRRRSSVRMYSAVLFGTRRAGRVECQDEKYGNVCPSDRRRTNTKMITPRVNVYIVTIGSDNNVRSSRTRGTTKRTGRVRICVGNAAVQSLRDRKANKTQLYIDWYSIGRYRLKSKSCRNKTFFAAVTGVVRHYIRIR